MPAEAKGQNVARRVDPASPARSRTGDVDSAGLPRDDGVSGTNPGPAPSADLARLVGDIARLETIFASWDEGPRGAVEAYRRAVDALHAEALRRLIRGLKAEPTALSALRDAAADEVVYAVLRHHEILRPSLNERVEAALADVRPMLAAHGGDVVLVKVDPPAIEVQFTGACDGCAASTLTFHAGVRKAVQAACPEVSEVRQVNPAPGQPSNARFVSPFALDQQGAWHPAGTLQDMPEGEVRAMRLGGEDVILFRRGAVVTCYQDACAHLGLALHYGGVEDDILTCPHHGFRYDLASGECLTAPEVQLQAHAVRVLGDRIEVRVAG